MFGLSFINTALPCDPASISSLPKRKQMSTQKPVYKCLVILFINAPNLKQLRYPSAGEETVKHFI